LKDTINTPSKRKYMSHIPSDELVSAPKLLSGPAFRLLMYYYSKGSTWSWDDDNMARELETNVREIKRSRKELVDKEFLLIVKGTITNVFIGRQSVQEWLGVDA